MVERRFDGPKLVEQAIPGVVFGALALLPLVAGQNLYLLRLAGSIGLYATLALGLNAVTGFAGVLDLGYVAFYGLGAYAYALLASYQLGLHLPFYAAALASALAGLAAALLLGGPTLHLRGDYLAIVTLAFGQIFRLLVTNLDRPFNLTNGPNGIVGVDPPSLGGGLVLTGLVLRLYLILGFAILVYLVTRRLDDSKYGRAWLAMKKDHRAARCLGVNVDRYRLLAFAYGAVVASLAGALFAMWQGAVFPQNFSLAELVTIFCMMVLGGTGSVAGSVVGAVVLVVLPELLRGYSIYRMLVYGLTLILVMRFRPQGLLPRRLRVPSRPRPANPGYAVPEIQGGRLEVTGLSVAFQGLKAVSGVSFTVAPGEVFGIIGPNGAGKTTLFNVVSGLYRPSSGSVKLDGEVISGLTPDAVARRGVARTFQNIRLFPEMTVEENILVGHHRRLRRGLISTLLALPGWRRMEDGARDHVREVLSFLGYGMLEKRYSDVASLNYADRRRVELARAVIANPKILLLDEPAAGMTEDEIRELIAQIKELNRAGYTILLIEHHMPVIMETCSRVMVLDHGQELALGAPAEIARNRAVIEAYLGGPAEEVGRRVTTGGTTESRPLLELRGVSVAYGPVEVLHDLDLTVREGELVCLLGSNAAGKSTTLKTVLGALPLKGGQIHFAGRRVDGRPTAEIVQAGIAIVPEGRRIFTRQTVRENLELGAYLNRQQSLTRNLERVYNLFPVLEERGKQKAGTLSGGEQQMLAIGRALMSEPRLLCLDEPTMGLSPLLVQTVLQVIREINAAGTSILLVEQNATAALGLADHLYLLRLGRLVPVPVSGRPDDLDELLRSAYLA